MEAFSVLSVLGLGFLIGLQHAFEADHMAAVGTMATDARGVHGVKKSSMIGVFWGLGHTFTLFLATIVVLLFKTSISESLAVSLERVVGILLVVLGVSVWMRMRREKIHLHTHEHDGESHVHLHSHRILESHHHAHLKKSFGVGAVHGLAGSAGLVVLSSAVFEHVGVALMYVLLFGIGSVVGMSLVTGLMGAALSKLQRFQNAIQFAMGLLSVFVGANLLF